MQFRRIASACSWFLVAVLPAAAQERLELPGDRQPLLQLQAGGPTSAVTALAFAFAGKGEDRHLMLYAAGYDKVVRSWARGAGDRFVPTRTYRVPIGPGAQGVLNALAVSPDGRWLAAAGAGVVREGPGFFKTGIVVPRSGRMTDLMLEDEGTIYLFDTAGDRVRLLRRHRGPVLALVFAPARAGKAPLLISLAREETADKKGHAGAVRLWHAETGEHLAAHTELPDPEDGRPGLAAWHTGDDVRAVAVAIACHGERLRVWDVADRRVVGAGEALRFNEGAVFLPGGDGASAGTLFTTGILPRQRARLSAWKVDGTARPAAPRSAALPANSLSYALALVPRRPGAADVALVQCFPQDRDPGHNAYRLLLTARQGEEVEVRADVALWRGGPRPALAASPDGSHLAVAGGPRHEVRLYAVGDLSGDRPAPRILHSEGVAFQRVGFVRKGASRGLLLVERSGGEGEGGLVFDTRQRLLTDERQGWEADAQDLKTGRWGVFDPREQRPDRGGGFAVFRGEERAGEVWLEKGQTYTAYALLPAGPFKVPLLAIAFVEKGVPYLGLWNVASGQQVRQLTGHINAIHALAFDAAGRRLISAAEDQTVCVWGLDDLESTLGRHGTLLGLALKQDRPGAALHVARLTPSLLNPHNAEALQGIAEDDRVEGLVVEGKVRNFASPHAFYEAIWRLQPPAPWEGERKQAGDRAVMRVAGRNIGLQVDQGIDDHKPLFALFVTAGVRPADRRWVGWSPQGPYDTGDLVRGERYIGWHFNTDRPDAPTAFGEAGKYRRDFYRDHILRYLLERGNLSDALKDWEKAPARGGRAELSIDGLDPRAGRDPAGHPIVQHTDLVLQARLTGIEPAKVQKVEWQLWRHGPKGPEPVSGPPRSFAGKDGLLEADLSRMAWQRGVHEARVVVTPLQESPVARTASVWLHYLPPAPTVEFPRAWLKETFGTEQAPERHDWGRKKFPLVARVVPGAAGPRVRIRLRHNGKVEEVDGPEVRKDIELRQGRNDVEVEAVNEGADESPELRKYESAVRRLVLDHSPETAAPRITLLAVVPADGEPVPCRPGAPVIVTTRRVQVRGEINSQEELTVATVATGEGAPRPLAGLGASRDRRALHFEQEVVLDRAGPLAVVFRAKAGEKEAEPQSLTLDYRPPVPLFRLESSRVIEADAEPETELVGQLIDRDGPVGYEVREVRVNGRKVSHTPLDGQRLRARAAIAPGHNAVRVLLAAGGRETETEPVDVYRKQPPRVLSFRSSARPGGQATTLEVVVRTVSGRPVTAARVGRTKIAGRPVHAKDVEWHDVGGDAWKRTADGDGETWTASLPGVALEAGANTFTLRVASEDGEAEGATTAAGRAAPPAAARPEVSLEDLPLGPVYRPSCKLTIRVRPAASATVRLLRNDREMDGKVLGEPATVEGESVYRIEKLPLEPGPNRLKIEAVNGGLVAEASATVTYVKETVDVFFDGVELVDRPGGALLPLDGDLPAGRVLLHGHVEWPTADDASLAAPMRVRSWVNDFEQFDPALLPAEGRVRKFRAPLCLNRTSNRVALEFAAEVKLKEGDRPGCVLKCARAEEKQRLHLLIVTPGERAPEEVTDRVLKTLGAFDRKGDRFRTSAFQGGGRVYGPVPWYAEPSEVASQLGYIKNTIRKSGGNFNDVVLVYFRGKMWSEGDKQYLRMWSAGDRAPLESVRVDCDQVRGTLAEVLGAKLLLLDVQGDRGALRASAVSPQVGDLTFLWLGPEGDPKRLRLLDDLDRSLAEAPLWGTLRQKIAAAHRQDERVTVQSVNPPGYDAIPLKRATD
jgi:WD40 repeat protein